MRRINPRVYHGDFDALTTYALGVQLIYPRQHVRVDQWGAFRRVDDAAGIGYAITILTSFQEIFNLISQKGVSRDVCRGL